MQPYGGFWIRFAAYIIDSILLYVVTMIITLVVGVGAGAGVATTGNPNMDATLVGEQIGAMLFSFSLQLMIQWLYFAVMESSARQATVGKIALGLIVTDEHGERIGFGRATGRFFAKFLSTIILLFGYFMVGWTQRKQGLHDMIAGTLVYNARSPDMVRTNAAVFE